MDEQVQGYQVELPEAALPLIVKDGPCYFDRYVEEGRKSINHDGPFFESIDYENGDSDDKRPRKICLGCVLKGIPVPLELQNAFKLLPVTIYDD